MRDLKNKTYRFWGSKPPAEGRSAVVRAEVAATDATEATLYLYGPIDSWGGPWGISAAEVATALATLPSGTTQLTMRINSPGGEVFEAVAIMNLLRDHNARIVARVDGIAASAASFLAASADETIMGGNTELMIHDAWGIAMGNAADMTAYADLLDRTSNNIADVYAAKAGTTQAAMREYMLAETWLSAEEAVALGLADSVNTGTAADPAAEPAARMAFDLKALFEHEGRAAAPDPAPIPAAPLPAATISAEQQADIDRRHKNRARAMAHPDLHAAGVARK